jgi:hypothetical protein
MSNLSRALVTNDTGKTVPNQSSLLHDFLSVDTSARESIFDLSREVRMSAVFSQKYLISHLETMHPDATRQIQKRLKRAIIESVFGEFRGNIQKINVALLNHDVRVAMEELDKLETCMFSVDD